MADFAKLVLFVTLVLFSFLFLGLNMATEEDKRKMKNPDNIDRVAKRLLGLMAALCLFLVIIPSKQTIYLMVGVTAFEDVAQTPELSKARRVLNQELDKMLEEK